MTCQAAKNIQQPEASRLSSKLKRLETEFCTSAPFDPSGAAICDARSGCLTGFFETGVRLLVR